MSKVKNFLKKIFPVPANTFHREIGRLNNNDTTILKRLDLVQKENEKLADKIETCLSIQHEQITLINKLVEDSKDNNKYKEEIKTILKVQSQRIDKLYNMTEKDLGVSSEVMWAEIYNDTIEGSNWLIDTSFSPGRWAINTYMSSTEY